jgi:hypothetical protein
VADPAIRPAAAVRADARRSGVSGRPDPDQRRAAMRNSVIGCGDLGAVQAAAMISALRAGEAPFCEPDLTELLEQGVTQGRLEFTTDM